MKNLIERIETRLDEWGAKLEENNIEYPVDLICGILFLVIGIVLLLIMPEDEYRQVHTDVLGFISSSLVSDDAFYQAILGHDPEKIRCHLQRILKAYFESALGL